MNYISALSDLRIEPKGEKGRAFAATYVASACADNLWQGGGADTGDIDRPVYAVFLGSDDELRPFVANLVTGRRALDTHQHRRASGFEFLRTAGYKVAWQREPEGSLATIFLPELFLLDPGMVDPKEVKFVLLPPKVWAAEQTGIPTVEIVRYARRLPLVKKLNAPPLREWERDRFEPPLPDEKLVDMVPTAYLFAAYLDRRTRAPLVSDGRFYLQLMLACLRDGLAWWSTDSRSGIYDTKFGHTAGHKFREVGTDAAGLLPGVSFRAEHAQLEVLLADEVALFFAMTEGK